MSGQLCFGGMPEPVEAPEPEKPATPEKLPRSVVFDEWTQSTWARIRVRAFRWANDQKHGGRVEELMECGQVRKGLHLSIDELRRLSKACLRLAEFLEKAQGVQEGPSRPSGQPPGAEVG